MRRAHRGRVEASITVLLVIAFLPPRCAARRAETLSPKDGAEVFWCGQPRWNPGWKACSLDHASCMTDALTCEAQPTAFCDAWTPSQFEGMRGDCRPTKADWGRLGTDVVQISAAERSRAVSQVIRARCPAGPPYRRDSPFRLEPGRSTVMKLDAARAMQTLHFCSRSGPPPFDDTWQPSAADVANLEASFEALEDNTRSGCIRDDWSVSDYYRWYVGLIGADGRRLIYVNAVLASVVGESEKDAGSWSDEFVDLCDGGLAAWGAVYDVEKHAFTVVEQNGSIE